MEALTRLFARIDYFLPNDDEALRLTGLADPEQQAARFLECGVGTVIITRGARARSPRAAGSDGVRRRIPFRASTHPERAMPLRPASSRVSFRVGKCPRR